MVKEELASGSIDPVEHDVVRPTGIHWDFKDDCWVAQCTREGGVEEKKIRCGPVMKRLRTPGDPCFGLSREDAKKVVLQGLSEWLSIQT